MSSEWIIVTHFIAFAFGWAWKAMIEDMKRNPGKGDIL